MSNNEMLMHIACVRNDPTAVRNLLANKWDPTQEDLNGHRPLDLACGEGHLEVVEILLADPRVQLNTPNRHGFTPLLIACSTNRPKVARFLINKLVDMKASLDDLDPHNRSPLLLACMQNDYETVQALLWTRAEFSQKNVAFRVSCAHGNFVCANELMKAGINPNEADHNQHTPIFLAFQRGNIGVAKHIFDAYKDNGLNIAQELKLAHENGLPDLVRMLEGKSIRPANAPLPHKNDQQFREGELFLLFGRKLQNQFHRAPGALSKEKAVKVSTVLNSLELCSDSKLRYWAESGYTRANLAHTKVRVVVFNKDCGEMSLMDVLAQDRHRFRIKKNAKLKDGEAPKLPKSYLQVRRMVEPQFLVEDAIHFLEATSSRLDKHRDGESKNFLVKEMISGLKGLNSQGYPPIKTLEELCRFTPHGCTFNLLQTLRTHRRDNDAPSKEPDSFIQFCKLFALNDLMTEGMINEIAPPRTPAEESGVPLRQMM